MTLKKELTFPLVTEPREGKTVSGSPLGSPVSGARSSTLNPMALYSNGKTLTKFHSLAALG